MLNETPQSIGGVLDAGTRFYRAQFLALTKTAGVVFGTVWVLNALLVAGFGVSVMPDPTAATTLEELYTPPVVALSLVSWLITTFGYAALFCQLDAAARSEPLTTAGALRAGLRRFVPVFVAFLLYGAIVALGLALLIVPGVWAATAFGLVLVLAAVDSGPIGALRGSAALVKGHWWRTTAIFLVITLIVFVLSFAFGGISGFIAGWSAAGGGPPSLGFQLFAMALNTIGSMLALPIAFAMIYAVYHDLKLRRSGDDLASRLDSL